MERTSGSHGRGISGKESEPGERIDGLSPPHILQSPSKKKDLRGPARKTNAKKTRQTVKGQVGLGSSGNHAKSPEANREKTGKELRRGGEIARSEKRSNQTWKVMTECVAAGGPSFVSKKGQRRTQKRKEDKLPKCGYRGRGAQWDA